MQPLSAVHRVAQKGDVEELRRLVKRVRHSSSCTQLKRVLTISHFLRPSMEANCLSDHCRPSADLVAQVKVSGHAVST